MARPADIGTRHPALGAGRDEPGLLAVSEHRRLVHTTLHGIAAGVCLAIGVYSALGLLQAVLAFEGARLQANVRVWLPLSIFFLGFGSWLAYRTVRLAMSASRHR